LKKHEQREGVDIYRMQVRQGNMLTKLISYLGMIPAVLSMIIRSDILIIYGRYFLLHRLVIIVARLLRKQIVFRSTLLGEDDIDSLLGRDFITRSVRKMVYSGISMYYAIAPPFSEIFRMHYKKTKLFESPQGVDVSVFFPWPAERVKKVRRRMNIPASVPVILSVGSLIARKGYLELFTILAEISAPFLYIIAGENELSFSPHLTSRAGEIDETIRTGKALLGERVRFIGMTDHAEEWYNVADLFVHNSGSEGLPNTLLECLACGTIPLIRNTADLEGYLIKDGINGYLFDHFSELKTTLSAFLENPVRIPDTRNEFAEHIRQQISFDNVYRNFVQSISDVSR
jgi:glycosyltransferase involved in cell wall biosynthesis